MKKKICFITIVILFELIVNVKAAEISNRWEEMPLNFIPATNVKAVKVIVCKDGYKMIALVMFNVKSFKQKIDYYQIFEYDKLKKFPPRRALCSKSIDD